VPVSEKNIVHLGIFLVDHRCPARVRSGLEMLGIVCGQAAGPVSI
jgi:hypothetical protein